MRGFMEAVGRFSGRADLGGGLPQRMSTTTNLHAYCCTTFTVRCASKASAKHSTTPDRTNSSPRTPLASQKLPAAKNPYACTSVLAGCRFSAFTQVPARPCLLLKLSARLLDPLHRLPRQIKPVLTMSGLCALASSVVLRAAPTPSSTNRSFSFSEPADRLPAAHSPSSNTLCSCPWLETAAITACPAPRSMSRSLRPSLL
mmetsp:Transcript_59043/g.111502  ORF Transcript_59043/g.111502 Transcript_59043/m.111502 type:complete len:201 (-) Transcript_59043:440-1042(-)